MNEQKTGAEITKQRKRHLTDKEFWTILTKNGGLFQRTADAIFKTYGIEITRAAVSQRAKKKPEQYAQIEEMNLDIAEGGLMGLMGSTDAKIRLNAIKYYLDSKGKKRGYVKQVNSSLVDGEGESVDFASLLMKASTVPSKTDE